MLTQKCQNCGNLTEEHLAGSPSKLCYPCLSKEVSFLSIFKTTSLSGAKILEKESKCCICNRALDIGDEAIKSDYGNVCYPCYSYTQSIIEAPIPPIVGAKKKWVLKSSLSIHGPFDQEQVVKGILAKNFSSLDELIAPLKMSTYIRDAEEFKESVKKVGGSEIERTIEITRSVTESQYGTDPGYIRQGNKEYLDVEFKDEKQAQFRISKLSFSLIVLLLVLSIGGLFYKYRILSPSNSFDHNLQRESANKNWELGFYKEALADYKDLESHGYSLSEQELINYALISIDLGQEISAKRAIEKVSESKFPLEKHLAMAKFHFSLNNQEEALAELNKANRLSENNELVTLNLWYLYLKSAQYAKFPSVLYRKTNLEEINGPLALLKVNYKIKTKLASTESEVIADEQVFRSFIDYRSILFTYLAILAKQNGYEKLSKNYLLEAVNFYPYEKNAFRQNPYLFVNSQPWKDLLAIFEESTLEQDVSFDVAKAMILYQLGRTLEAQKNIAIAMEKSPSSDMVQSWNMLINKSSPQVPATNFDPFTLDSMAPLHLIIVGDVCVSKRRWECAEQVFGKVQSIKPKEVYPMYRLAQVLQRKANNETVKLLVSRALGFAPRYKALLALEQEIKDK